VSICWLVVVSLFFLVREPLFVSSTSFFLYIFSFVASYPLLCLTPESIDYRASSEVTTSNSHVKSRTRTSPDGSAVLRVGSFLIVTQSIQGSRWYLPTRIISFPLWIRAQTTTSLWSHQRFHCMFVVLVTVSVPIGVGWLPPTSAL
jgi:hypothetical protein